MRGVVPALVCSVGNLVVAMDASLFGNRCSFMGSPINPPAEVTRETKKPHAANRAGLGISFIFRHHTLRKQGSPNADAD